VTLIARRGPGSRQGQDVVRLLVEQNLTNVVLVGHSYAGTVISGVADLIPERIGHLVYLAAIVPMDGES
jgi:pimeloyl-ACP methyl ester carboxylesterase